MVDEHDVITRDRAPVVDRSYDENGENAPPPGTQFVGIREG
jgi:hypothetical protein